MSDQLERLQTALADRYAIEREIGAGGMAIVYLAQDIKHGRQVAVKVLRPELATALGSERFLREIKIAAGLAHPHILGLHDSGEAEGFLYYVMPYLEGESLRDRLTREKQLSLDDALRLTREVADALSFAHSRAIVHRDIKPENILLAGGHAVVADFGIARAIEAAGGDQLTATGLSLGTPAYMSPEQAAGEDAIDGRSDVYSLGCMLFEMLAGDPPFVASTPQALLARKLSQPAPALAQLRDTVPRSIEQIAAKALCRVAADRFATAADFADAIASASASSGAPGAPAPDGDAPARRMAEGSAPASAAPPTGLVANVEFDDVKTFDPKVATVLSRAREMLRPRRTSVGVERSGVFLVAIFTVALFGAGGYYYTAIVGNELPLIGNPFAQPDGVPVTAMPFVVDEDSLSPSRFPPDAVTVGNPMVVTAQPDPAAERAVESPAPEPPQTPTPGVVPDSATVEQSLAVPPPEGTVALTVTPASAVVRIDDRERIGTRHALPPGEHRLTVSAPGYVPFESTVTVIVGETTRLDVTLEEELAPVQCETFNTSDYNTDGSCFDSQPRPLEATLVPLTDDIEGNPSPATLAIKVNADGSVAVILVRTASDNAAFTQSAVVFAQGIEYHPAEKNGRRVVGWTQQVFSPGPRR